jgi:hypothetical protein
VGAPEDGRATLAARGRGPPGIEQQLDLEQTLLDLGHLGAALEEQVLAEAVLPVHLHHQPAEVAEPALALA